MKHCLSFRGDAYECEKQFRLVVRICLAFVFFLTSVCVGLYRPRGSSEKAHLNVKPRSHLAEDFFRLFTIDINSAIANNLKPIAMMKMQCVTVYPNICECVLDYMKIHHDRF